MGQKVRVFLITQSEPFYIPKVVRHLLDHQGDDYEVVGATVLLPHRKNKTIFDWFKERSQVYTLPELLLAGSAVGYCMMHRKLTSGAEKGRYSVRNLIDQRGVPHEETDDINSLDYVERLKAYRIDVILSVSPPQIFKADLLGVPSRYSLNAHGTLLPRHRGVFGSWWTLYCGDKEAGATLHTMELRLDAGEIAWQKAVPVRPHDTQYSIAYETKKLLAEGLVETLRDLRNDTLTFKPKRYEESYHRAPTKEEGEDFHRKGYHVIVPRDLRYMLAGRFGEVEQG